jgi:hypothetical protein
MKLTTEKNEELKSLSRCFEKIETAAANMGVEIEDLMQEYKNNNTAAYATFKKSILEIAKKRQGIFKHTDKSNAPEGTALSEMSILAKEDNKQ